MVMRLSKNGLRALRSSWFYDYFRLLSVRLRLNLVNFFSFGYEFFKPKVELIDNTNT